MKIKTILANGFAVCPAFYCTALLKNYIFLGLFFHLNKRIPLTQFFLNIYRDNNLLLELKTTFLPDKKLKF